MKTPTARQLRANLTRGLALTSPHDCGAMYFPLDKTTTVHTCGLRPHCTGRHCCGTWVALGGRRCGVVWDDHAVRPVASHLR